MVQVLPQLKRQPSFAQELAAQLGAGLGKGISRGTELAMALQKEKALANRKRLDKLSDIPLKSAKFLKEFAPTLYENPKAKEKITNRATELYEQGFDYSDATRRAIEEHKSQKRIPAEAEGLLGPLAETPERGLLQEYLEPAISAVKQKPSLLASELPTALTKSLEGLAGLADPMTMLNRLIGKQPQASDILSQKLRQSLPEELKSGAERVSDIESFILDLLAPIPGGRAGKISKVIPGIAKPAGRIAGEAFAPSAELAEELPRSLAGRIGRTPETATEMRIARAKPTQRLFPTAEREAIRSEQLKAFPKYAEEIAKDAEERALRLESRIPKTVKGMQAQEIRMHEAQKNLPKIQESYTKAAGRLRALENEIARLPEAQKAELKPLYEAAQQEMQDATFALKQGVENLRGESVRKGAEDMRRAAQEKMLQIADQISAGEEVKLAKMDYNPEMIRLAKSLSKKKPLPSVGKDDFYQQVHQIYGDQYRKQLERVNAQIKEPVKSMSQALEKRNLAKERDILKKLIDQTEAEQAIHRHKLGLRETSERKKLQERLSQFKKLPPEPKVQSIAKERIQQAIRNPLGPEGQEIAAKAGIQPEELKGTVDKFGKMWGEASDKIVKSKGKVTSKLHKDLKDLFKTIQAEGMLAAAKTNAGKQILTAIGLETLNQVLGEPIPYGPTLISAIVGGKGSGIRTLTTLVIRSAKNAYIKEKYKRAVLSEDEETASEIRKAHPKLAKKALKSLF